MERSHGQFSCIAISAAIRSCGLPGDRIAPLEQLSGQKCGILLDPGCWLDIDRWTKAAEAVIEICSSKKNIFLEAGRRVAEVGLAGAIEFFPWFLSTPQLVLRNFEFFHARLDTVLKPMVDYVTEDSCRLEFDQGGNGPIPPIYFDFLRGYLESIIGLWSCQIKESDTSWLQDGRVWSVYLKWTPPEFHCRRALEALFVKPGFFRAVTTELFSINHQRTDRLNELLRLNQHLRSLALRSFEGETREADNTELGQRQYLGLFTSIGDGIFRITTEGRVLDANAAALKMLGFRSIEEVDREAPTIDRLVLKPRQLAKALALFRRDGVLKHFPASIRTRYGSPLDVLVSAFTVSDPRTGEDVIEGVLQDVTDSRRVRRELGQTHRFLEAIFDNSPSGLQVIDYRGRIIRANARMREMFGFDTAKVIGSPKYNALADPDMERAGVSGILRRAFEGETVQAPLIKLSEGDSPFFEGLSSPLYVTVAAYPLQLEERRVTHVVASFTDMTESYLIEQQISQLHKLQSINTLASGIAHDFNNILGAIVPSAEMILAQAEDTELIKRKATAIKISAKRAAALTSQLMSFARESRGDKRAIDPQETVREALELIDNAIPKKVVLGIEVEKNLPQITADSLQLQQVIINLVINACDALPRGGNVSVRLTTHYQEERTTFAGNLIPPGRFVQISVEDSGEGMPAEVAQRVFDPFFTTKEKGKGTGLGLSVVHGIIKNHGGFIHIDSRMGAGTRFDVYLPARREDPKS